MEQAHKTTRVLLGYIGSNQLTTTLFTGMVERPVDDDKDQVSDGEETRASISIQDFDQDVLDFMDAMESFFEESVHAGGLSERCLRSLDVLDRFQEAPIKNSDTVIDPLTTSDPIKVRNSDLGRVFGSASELEVYHQILRSKCSTREANEWLRIITKVGDPCFDLYAVDIVNWN
jgi:hypothetical protein